MKKKNFILIIFLLIILYAYTNCVTLIPKDVILMKGEKLNYKSLPGIEFVETTKTSITNVNNTNIDIKLFGKLSLKSVNVTSIENMEVVPVGKIVGLKLYTNGILVVGMSEIEDKNNNLSKPYANTDIKAGDTILKIDENEVENINKLKELVNNSEGNSLELTILRNGNVITTSIVPTQTKEDDFKLGLWVKDAATGVGTMTFYEPVTKSFAILGHGITDPDTERLIDIDSGELVTSKVLDIKKAEIGTPGEIKGTILNQQTIGNVTKNTDFGVFGTLNNLTALNINTNETIKVALRDEIEQGEAEILCTLDENNISKKYKIQIEKIYKDNDYNNKSMLIKIVDKELLEKSGGIIRGLSGAPIIQNGKFIGAVTNVLISSPDIGYAIFGDLMIKQMKK